MSLAMMSSALIV